MDAEQRLDKVMGDIVALRKDHADLSREQLLISERQQRMHDDMVKLDATLTRVAQGLEKLVNFVSNRRGFFAGVAVTFTLMGSLVASLAWLLWEKVSG